MKILCLHGVGSSGAIFEAQMANLRRELDSNIELVFVDGPFQCERGPGVSQYRAGPFYSHTQGYSPDHISQAVDLLQYTLEDEGPFDGIFGFSQGSALTLSYLYRQQAAGNPVHIRFACLFSTAMPCSPDSDMGEEIITGLQALQYDLMDPTNSDGRSRDLTTAEQEFVNILQQTILEAATQDSHFPWVDMGIYRHGEPKEVPRVMYPSLLAQKIGIPTVHVWGQNDFEYMIKMAQIARSICDESTSKMVLHSGLHDLPKKQMEIKSVLRQLEWAMNQT